MTRKKERPPGARKAPGAVLFISALLILCSPALAETEKTGGPFSGGNSARGRPNGNVTLDAGHVYSAAPPQKSLQTSSQFKVVDDFNSKEWKNKLDGFWRLENAKAGQVTMEHPKEDARGLRPGYSLKAVFDLRNQQQFTLYSSLKKLDMSQAHFLAAKCKVVPAPRRAFYGKIGVVLTDWTGKSVEQDITGSCTETANWNEAVLPMERFKGLDLDQLSRISFTVKNSDKPSQAAFWLDEVVFFGHNEVGFESVLDNIEGFPTVVLDHPAKEDLLKTPKQKEFLYKVGRSVWRYFETAVDKKTHMVLDHVKVGEYPMAGVYTSPTNIAMDLMSTVAAAELGYIPRAEAEARTKRVLETLRTLKKWKGFFHNFYETTKLSVSSEFVSSIDNGWLAAALIVVRQAYGGRIAEDATRILDGFQFQQFLDPANNHLAIGYDIKKAGLTPYHYGMLVTEARAMSFIGIGKGDLPRDHWWYLYRTAPEAWNWQTQKPSGKWVSRDGVEYFQGYYKIGDKKLVPSWGGSLFEFLMPTLVIPETRLAPKGLGMNDRTATQLHRDYALNEKKYPVWGISPAAVSDGRRWQYGEYGIRRFGVKGYPDKGVLAPYASFLALETLPDDAVKNLRRFLDYDIYGEYGFYDSLNLVNGRVTHQYLVLDQGMSLIAIANYLKKGVIQNYFMKDPIAQKAKDLLEKEAFF